MKWLLKFSPFSFISVLLISLASSLAFAEVDAMAACRKIGGTYVRINDEGFRALRLDIVDGQLKVQEMVSEMAKGSVAPKLSVPLDGEPHIVAAIQNPKTETIVLWTAKCAENGIEVVLEKRMRSAKVELVTERVMSTFRLESDGSILREEISNIDQYGNKLVGTLSVDQLSTAGGLELFGAGGNELEIIN